MIDPGAFKFLGIVEFLSVIVFAVSVFLGGKYCFFGLLIIFFLFGLFYAFSPSFVNLKKFNYKSKRKQDNLSGTRKRSGKDTDTEIFSN